MEHLYIRGHPPWYARGTPVVKLRDAPHTKIRGKPLFTSNEVPKPRGKPPDKIGLWVQKFTLFLTGKMACAANAMAFCEGGKWKKVTVFSEEEEESRSIQLSSRRRYD